MRLYCGVNETTWNRHPVSPGPYACVSPVYGSSSRTKRENAVAIPPGTIVLQDSGAFCDGPGERLSFQDSLERQIEHSKKYGYAVSRRASYDLLIDEMWEDGARHKGRWSEGEAWTAVEETIAAADYMRINYNGPRVLSAQGVTPSQYMECVRAIVPMLGEDDAFGLGGWCISGKFPSVMMPVFANTIRLVIPYLAKNEVRQVHIWGVIDSEFLGPLLWMCDRFGIKLSTDSAGPQMRPAWGTWGYKGWVDRDYVRPGVDVRGLHRAEHVRATRQWLAQGLRKSPYYHEPLTVRAKYKPEVTQRSLF